MPQHQWDIGPIAAFPGPVLPSLYRIPSKPNSLPAGEFGMADSKRKKYRSLRTTHRPEKKQGKRTGTKELVLTLSVPDGEVIKVETLEKSGQRKELSEEQFAAFAGEDEGEDISPEEAYAAGIADAGEDEFEFDEDGGDEEEIERFVLREMVARQLLRRGVRRFILRRLRRRELMRQQTRHGSKGAAHEAAQKASHNNGHEGGKEGG
jgi:hypothetical protein